MTTPVRLRALLLGVAFASAAAFADELWQTDFKAASEKAKASNRYLLLDFSGSDWCGWCMRLDKEVFSQPAFQQYAASNLVCVLLDFPKRTKLPDDLAKQNEELSNQFGVQGFPTVLILSPKGELVERTGYQEGGPAAYIAHLQQIIEPHRKKNKIAAPQDAAAAKNGKLARAAAAKPLPRDEHREIRNWTASGGATVEAAVLDEQGVYVRLRKADGAILQIAKAQLSAEDQKYIAELKAALAAKK